MCCLWSSSTNVNVHQSVLSSWCLAFSPDGAACRPAICIPFPHDIFWLCGFLSLFRAAPAQHNLDNLQCGHEPDFHRHHVESSRLNFWSSFNCNPRQWWSCSFIWCHFLRQFQLKSHHHTDYPSFAASCALVNGWLDQLFPRTTPLVVTHETAPVRSRRPTKIRCVMLANELTPSSPILRNQNFSPKCTIGFLLRRPVRLSSTVFASLPLLILFMTCAA